METKWKGECPCCDWEYNIFEMIYSSGVLTVDVLNELNETFICDNCGEEITVAATKHYSFDVSPTPQKEQ